MIKAYYFSQFFKLIVSKLYDHTKKVEYHLKSTKFLTISKTYLKNHKRRHFVITSALRGNRVKNHFFTTGNWIII